jgi:hypothetical protein
MMKDKFWLVVIAASVSLCIFAYLQKGKLSDESREERSFRQYCGSKFSGSRPQCWSEEDWGLFCKKVHCNGEEQ